MVYCKVANNQEVQLHFSFSDVFADRDKIAYGDLLSSTGNSPNKAQTLAPESGRHRENSSSSSKLTSRLTAVRRSLPHKFKHSRATPENEPERARAARRTSVHVSGRKCTASESVDRLDVSEENRGRQSSGQAGVKHYLEQFKHSLNGGKLKKGEESTCERGGSWNELDRSGDELSKTASSSKRASIPRSVASSTTLRQMREIEREFGPLVEQDSSFSSAYVHPLYS